MRDFTHGGWVLVLAVTVVPRAGLQAQTPETSPAPGEEVMRPTDLGLRLTPAMARAMTSAFLADAGDLQKLEMTSEQKERLTEAAARRMMSIAHRDGREAQAGLEFLIETMMTSMDGSPPKIADYREFGDRMQPLVRDVRELFKGFCEDARPILNAEQMKQLEAQAVKADRYFGRLDQRLEDYRAGRFEEGQDPFEGLDDEDQDRSAKPKVNDEVRQAQNQARWEVHWNTEWTWGWFLAGATVVFKFDEGQKAKSRALLAKYEKEAEAIQTPEWTARIRRNRVQANLRYRLQAVPSGPYMHRLEKEYREATRPLREMTGEFYKEMLAMATPQQRAQAMEDAQSLFEKHGLKASEAELAWLQGLLEPGAEGAERTKGAGADDPVSGER